MSDVIALPLQKRNRRLRQRNGVKLPSATIHDLNAHSGVRTNQVIELLEFLLSHARRGHIAGLAWAASIPEGVHPSGVRVACDVVGEAASDPVVGHSMAISLSAITCDALYRDAASSSASLGREMGAGKERCARE